jgi:hypothetical protein
LARKKSKGSKKSRAKKDGAKKAPATAAKKAKKPAKKAPATAAKKPATIPGDQPEPKRLDADSGAPGAPDPELIDLDDVGDDIGALIAAAAAVDEPITLDLDDSLEDAESRDGLIAEALALVEGADEGAPSNEMDASATSADADADDRPLIGAEALLALSEIRAEGVASKPAELVLDLGEETTPEERDRLLAAALAHAEMQEAVYRVPLEQRRSRRIKSGIAAAIFFLAAVAAVNPPDILVPAPPPLLSEEDRATGVLVALTLQAQQVEAFRAANGRLPRSIDEIEQAVPGVRYVLSTGRLYQLVAYGPDGEPVVYDSSAPRPEFERLWRTWATTSDETAGGLR